MLTERHVFANTGIEQANVLWDEGTIRLPCGHLLVCYWHAIQKQFTLCRGVETKKKVRQRGLSASGLANEGNPRSNRDGQVDALNNELITAEIIEAHIIELDQSPGHDALRRGNSWVTE